jgi:hypothetical protein
MAYFRIRWVGIALALGTPGLVVACGLEVNGLSSSDADSGTVGFDDAGADARDVPDAATGPDTGPDTGPPMCATINTSCLAAAVPSGWTLVGVGTGAKSCPSADFDTASLVTNPRLSAASCACGACATQGSYTCGGFTLKFGFGCNASPMSQNSSPACVGHSEGGRTPGSPEARPRRAAT